ncbi:hypothetical protein NNJEOMEG_02781 [Fundidesulfovibrio magnetotacticus]|uniref:Uncharacterized protein n=1 Tax=Fundidesulfovibrio magnetotacticus TaxID=2730080 RepID=A0A6V8LR21_9BACT|nr:hypothetical protein NNJEOMEG_02781 [Fundidesulfovibrio magnetotacticus]
MNVIHCAADLPSGDIWIYGAGGRGPRMALIRQAAPA